MSDSLKADTVFSLRYAMRVLERHASLWRKAAYLLKFLGLLSGTLALASLTADKQGAALWLGVFFAVAQCLDHVFSPAEKALLSEVQRKRYGEVWARSGKSATEALAGDYEALVAEDAISPSRALRELAFDDVVREQGLDAASCYGGNRVMRLLS